MIQTPFNPAILASQEKIFFDNWNKLAQRVQDQLNRNVQAGLRPKFRSEIWSALKHWLLENVFHGKCAYCELNIEAGFVGDAEHYRPKAAVTEVVGGRPQAVIGPDGEHPGYYWVAYDWRNLVPSCQRCNSVHGKKTQFPIRGSRAYSSFDASDVDALDALESPILLHPYDRLRDPKKHLAFAPDGRIIALDEVGQVTIDVFDLDRDKLTEARRLHIEAARAKFGIEVGHAAAKADVQSIKAKVDKIHSEIAAPTMEFSAATRDVLAAVRASLGL